MKIRGNTVGTPISVEKIAEKIGTGGSLEPLIVDIDNDACVANRTSTQILSAYEARQEIRGQLYYPGDSQPHWLTLLSVDEDYAVFAKFEADGTWQSYCVDNDGVVYGGNSLQYATADQIGDISSALDELHIYAQGFIPGGASE